MCSLTFVPQARRYLVAMNRDENLGREVAHPPSVHRSGAEVWIGPDERSSGGTWIASSGRGITLALLNPHPPQTSENDGAWRSRGVLIPQLIGVSDVLNVNRALSAMELANYRPFQLVAIFPEERIMSLHRWDGASIEVEQRPWSLQQVFSSGMSDAIATEIRVATAHGFSRPEGEDEQVWVRRLHSSHLPEREPLATASIGAMHKQ